MIFLSHDKSTERTFLKALNPRELGKYKTTPGGIWTMKVSTLHGGIEELTRPVQL